MNFSQKSYRSTLFSDIFKTFLRSKFFDLNLRLRVCLAMCLIFQQSEPSVLINRVLTEKKMCMAFYNLPRSIDTSINQSLFSFSHISKMALYNSACLIIRVYVCPLVHLSVCNHFLEIVKTAVRKLIIIPDFSSFLPSFF